jgi:hypothetical protein
LEDVADLDDPIAFDPVITFFNRGEYKHLDEHAINLLIQHNKISTLLHLQEKCTFTDSNFITAATEGQVYLLKCMLEGGSKLSEAANEKVRTILYRRDDPDNTTEVVEMNNAVIQSLETQQLLFFKE